MKVGSSVRSRRGPGSAATESTTSRASCSSARRKPRPGPRSQSSAAETSRATAARAQLAQHPAPSGPELDQGDPPVEVAPVSPERRSAGRARTAAPRRRSGPAARPRRRECRGPSARPAPLRGRALNPAPAPRTRDGTRPPSTPSARRRPSSAGVSGIVERPDVGLDPLAGQRDPVGGEELADRQVQGAAVGEVDHLLEDALAEGSGPDHRGVAVVGESRGEDLRRRGGVAVDQHDHRARRQVAADRLVDGAALGPRTGRDDDLALGQEDARGQHRLLQQPAAVAAQVEDDALGAGCSTFLDRAPQEGVGALGEAEQGDVAELAAAGLGRSGWSRSAGRSARGSAASSGCVRWRGAGRRSSRRSPPAP